MNLVFINELGPNFRGDNIYEFIFSDIDDVHGDEWDSETANGKPTPPYVEFIKKVGVLKNSEVELELIQNSDYFSMKDAVDGVVCLGWESDKEKDERLVFRFGEKEEETKNKLYSQDLILGFEKVL
jgi:hypothetical protein